VCRIAKSENEFLAAIIIIKAMPMAVLLVDIESTYPTPAAALALLAQPIFPTLPIMLLSRRVGGFSRSWAAFDLAGIIGLVNADDIDWRIYRLPEPCEKLPF